MRKTNDQVDGALKVVFEKFREYEVNFHQSLTKHAVYDELVNRRRQPQGKGPSSGSAGWQEPQYGLIHDKNINMPLATRNCGTVQTRDAIERALSAIPAKRMGVGNFAEQHHHQQQEKQPEIPFPGIDPSWGEPWTQVCHCQDQDNSLFVFGKGGKKG